MKDRDDTIDRLLARTLRIRAEGPGMGDCPSAEELAAWHDQTLRDPDHATIEQHVADCARCQAHLAAIVRMTPQAQVAERASWPHLWRWVVPAGAAATAVALWLAVQPSAPPVAPREVPETQAPAAAAPPAPAASDEAVARDVARERPPLDRARPPRTQADRPTQRAADSRRAPSEEQRKVAKEDAAAKAPPAEVRRERDSAPSRDRAAVAAAPPASLAESAAPRGFEIASPDPAVRWRVGGSTIERSTDGGMTWETQLSARDMQLTAGACPAATVCWIVGRSGVVLLSTDGGRTWRRLSFPEAIDLSGITATSPTTATVTTSDGRRLATSDGGMTWSPR